MRVVESFSFLKLRSVGPIGSFRSHVNFIRFVSRSGTCTAMGILGHWGFVYCNSTILWYLLPI